MNIEKAEQIFSLMRKYGIDHFKTDKIEIRLSNTAQEVTRPDPTVATKSKSKTKIPPQQAVPIVDAQIPHHVNEVAKLLKLNDNELVDKLFPDYSQVGN